MTVAEQIRLLTEDPGANQLAKIVDALQAQVNACCGGDLHNATKPGTDAKTPTPAADPIPELKAK